MSSLSLIWRAQWDIGAGRVDLPGFLTADLTLESATGSNGLGFGPSTVPRATLVTTGATQLSLAQLAALPRVWLEVGAVGGLGFQPAFAGVITQDDDDGASYTLSAAGMMEVIRRAPVRTPVRVRRPIATQTTAGSVEDPASGSHRAGLINEAFWRAGGRPWEQAAAYPSAPFYYRCDPTPIAPAYGYVDGESAWDALLGLATAAGGQIYQDALGVMHYVNPLRLGVAGGSPIAYTPAVFATIARSRSLDQVFSSAVSNYTERAPQGEQVVLERNVPELFAPSQARTIDLPMDWPILSYAGVAVQGSIDGAAVTPTPTIVEASALLLRVTITNPSATAPLLVSLITVRGDPIGVVSEGRAVVSSGGAAGELRLDDSDLIQTLADAERRCRMALAFYGAPRPSYALGDIPLNAAAIPGVDATLTMARYGLSAAPARITQVANTTAGLQQVTLVDTSGVPRLTDFFLVGTAYSDGDTRRVGY